jgi:hydrogenase-4 membrane subunit HyfE
LIPFLIVLVVPLVTATWRMSLFGLALQGILLGWMAIREHEALSPALLLLVVDCVLIRGLFAPRYLYGIMKSRNAPQRNDVIPANLFFWALAGTIVLLAFRCGRALSHGDAASATLLGVVATAVALGFLILATQNAPFSQIVGVLRIENGIALFELGSPHHHPLPVAIGATLVYLASVLYFGWFLRSLFLAEGVPDPQPARPTL